MASGHFESVSKGHMYLMSVLVKKSETGDRAKEDLKYLKRKKGENKFCG